MKSNNFSKAQGSFRIIITPSAWCLNSPSINPWGEITEMTSAYSGTCIYLDPCLIAALKSRANPAPLWSVTQPAGAEKQTAGVKLTGQWPLRTWSQIVNIDFYTAVVQICLLWFCMIQRFTSVYSVCQRLIGDATYKQKSCVRVKNLNVAFSHRFALSCLFFFNTSLMFFLDSWANVSLVQGRAMQAALVDPVVTGKMDEWRPASAKTCLFLSSIVCRSVITVYVPSQQSVSCVYYPFAKK